MALDFLSKLENHRSKGKKKKTGKGFDSVKVVFMQPPGGNGPDFNTGAGANGIVEPGKAAALDMNSNPPSLLHEGEDGKNFPGGRQITPASMSGMYVPKTEKQQQQLSDMSAKLGLPGFFAGGQINFDPATRFAQEGGGGTKTPPETEEVTSSVTASPPTNTPVFYTPGGPPIITNSAITAGTPALNAQEDFANKSSLENIKSVSDSFSNVAAGELTSAQQEAERLAQIEVDKQAQIEAENQAKLEAERQAKLDEAARLANLVTDDPIVDDPVVDDPIVDDPIVDDPIVDDPIVDDPTVDDPTVDDPPTKGEMATDEALAWLKDMFNGENEALKAKANKLLQSNDAATAARILAQGQRMATREGLTTGAAQATLATMNRDAASERSQLVGDIAVESQKMMVNAAGTVAELGMNMDRLDIAKENFELLKQSHEEGEIAQMAADIAVGATFEQMEKEYGLDRGAYDSMLDASILGERDFNRQMTQVSTLLGAGGEANVENAGRILNELLPGMNIDMSNAINADNAEMFGSVLDEMRALTTEFDFDSLPQDVLDNWAKSLGMDASDVGDMFNNVDINSIDASWSLIEDSEWFAGQDAEGQEITREMFNAVYSGELQYKMVDEFTVTLADGSTRMFTNETVANSYAKENNGEASKSGRRVVFADSLTGNTINGIEGAGAIPPAGTPKNGLFADGGVIYKNGADGVYELDPSLMDAWGVDANNMIKMEDDSIDEYRKVIISKRADDIVSGTRVENEIEKGSDLYNSLLGNPMVTVTDPNAERDEYTKGLAASKEFWYFPSLNDLEQNTNKVVSIYGELFYYTNKVEEYVRGSDSNAITYNLKSLDTGEPYYVRAASLKNNAALAPVKL